MPSFVPDVPWFSQSSAQSRHLVGVSGGADSTALLHLLVGSGFRDLIVCHLDHSLRGAESAGDADFVKSLAASLRLPCEVAKEKVAVRANGRSLETAGREARHEFFAACAIKHDCSRVLLAHHADDRAETVLWNLLRGSHGARGMRSSQEITIGNQTLEILRPLLHLRRADLRRYLDERALPWREDATNAEAIAIRNRLRNEALPLLSEITGRDVIPILSRAADAAEDQAEVLTWALDQANVLDPQGRLHVPAMRALPPAMQRAAIHRFLGENGIGNLDRELLENAALLLDPDSATSALNLPGNKYLRRRAGRIVVE